jgi:hypothetical protein
VGLFCFCRIRRYTGDVAQNGFRYSEEEQREIIEVAARLQREDGESLTRDELTLAAAEAGIEPKYVEEAIRRRQTLQRTLEVERKLPKAVLPFLFVAQLIGVAIVTAGGSMWEYGGIHWAGLMFIAFAWGCATGGSVSKLRRTAATFLQGTAGAALIAAIGVRAIGGPFHMDYPMYMLNLLLAESAAIVAGCLLASAMEKSARKAQLSGID